MRAFVDAINRRDLGRLSSLASADHCFVDSLGRVLRGREVVLDAWRRYFELFPDYTIHVTRMLSSGPTLGLFGFATGTLARGRAWRVPAAWLAEVRAREVCHWQVYADNEPVYDLLAAPPAPA